MGIFILIIVVSLSYAYIVNQDCRDLDRKIAARQGELDRIIKLKKLYLAKKRSFDRAASRGGGESVATLAQLEEIVANSFVGGRLTMLKPSLIKEGRGKGKKQDTMELKIGGATLGEVITFVTTLESAGLYVKKLQLSMPAAGQVVIDMYVIVAGGGAG